MPPLTGPPLRCRGGEGGDGGGGFPRPLLAEFRRTEEHGGAKGASALRPRSVWRLRVLGDEMINIIHSIVRTTWHVLIVSALVPKVDRWAGGFCGRMMGVGKKK